MNIFKRIYINVRESVVRFPASLLLGVACSVFASILIFDDYYESSEKILLSYLKTCSWGIVFSVFLQLCMECLASYRSFPKKKVLYLASQSLSILFCLIPMRILFSNESIFTWICYLGTLFALILGIFYLLKFIHGENLLAYAISYSFSIAGIASWCIGCGCTIIALAIQHLILKEKNFTEEIYMVIWIASFYIFAVQFFIAYFSRKDEFVIPKAVTVICFYILLPLYVILLGVLYIYIIQSLILRTMPHMNWFVSIATSLFIAFWFSLRPFENKVTKFFYKIGAYFLFPLVLIQWINFIQRIHAYGFTTTRVASLYYIIFSTVFLILSVIRCGKYNFHAIWGLAAIILIASITPFNIKTLAVRSQVARIEKIFKSHNLFKDGKIIPADNENEFSKEEKKQIADSFSTFGISLSNPSEDKKLLKLIPFIQAQDSSEDAFKKAFGFEKLYSYDEGNYFSLYVRDDFVLDISGYSQMCRIDGNVEKDKDGKFYLKSALGNIDVTDFIHQVMKSGNSDAKEPLMYTAQDGTVLYFTNIHIRQDIDMEEKFYVMSCDGYVLKK
ncbi:MAG: DUF4153 domain-containing protein [Treponema sp.]|nr:DUF4153 domain-containing protein [Treponema sp.]